MIFLVNQPHPGLTEFSFNYGGKEAVVMFNSLDEQEVRKAIDDLSNSIFIVCGFRISLKALRGIYDYQIANPL